MEKIIAYCERTDFSFWSEPVNAATNAAFLLVALWVWPRTRGLGLARMMVWLLALIGIGSFLWHTHATRWAGLADVLPIMAFILLYLYAATRDYLDAPVWAPWLAVILFVPYAAKFSAAANQLVPGLGANGVYLSVAVLITGYGLYLRRNVTGQGLLIGAGLLIVSLGFRIVDPLVCDSFPLGTHFMWHLLNAAMLGWMILVYCRHMRAQQESPDQT
ncbi:MAG: hypothetical protein EA339_00485 [Rhodobacteraceae bacterium]|nr:MAG: hypothetical protein EA339_00485 [Paracoccaceae bacterium]